MVELHVCCLGVGGVFFGGGEVFEAGFFAAFVAVVEYEEEDY